MRLSSSGASIFCSSPACSARHREPASAIRITSAGEAAPSAFTRSISWGAAISSQRTLIPVFLVKAS